MQNTNPFVHYDRIVIHTPHAGTILPFHHQVVRSHGTSPIAKERTELIRPYFEQLTDHYTDKLFSYVAQIPNEMKQDPKYPCIQQVSFPFSRLFCDVERLKDDPLEQIGLGIHYDLKKLAGIEGIFWHYDKEEALKMYNQHNDRLASIICPQCGLPLKLSLLLDCHSFSERDNILCPNAHEFKDIDICLGFNEDETKPSERFIESIHNFFTRHGYRVAYNFPFSNSKTIYYDESLYPDKPHYHSLMIEVNKHCYMNEDTFKINEGYYLLHKQLQQLYESLLMFR